jgi:chemotaxis methyl-accepting protein methylase
MIRRCLDGWMLQSGRIWRHLPDWLKNHAIGRAYGKHLHASVCRHSKRVQNHSTFFMRNRPEMELMCRLVGQKPHGAKMSVTVLACSKGAEVYSILWSIRASRPDLKVTLQAVDISREIIDFAQEGVYSLRTSDSLKALQETGMSEEEKVLRLTCRDQGSDQSASIFERMDQSEMDAMFDQEGDRAKIKPWIKEGISWRIGDASAPELVDELGTQDLVVANRFLCHMQPAAAESCLRNVARLVKPGGYLFVSGVDLDVRTKIAKEMGWQPVSELTKEIHEGDLSLATGWPLGWWGLEPFSQSDPDWKTRYASVFQVGETQLFSPDGTTAPLIGSPRVKRQPKKQDESFKG